MPKNRKGRKMNTQVVHTSEGTMTRAGDMRAMHFNTVSPAFTQLGVGSAQVDEHGIVDPVKLDENEHINAPSQGNLGNTRGSRKNAMSDDWFALDYSRTERSWKSHTRQRGQFAKHWRKKKN